MSYVGRFGQSLFRDFGVDEYLTQRELLRKNSFLLGIFALLVFM